MNNVNDDGPLMDGHVTQHDGLMVTNDGLLERQLWKAETFMTLKEESLTRTM